jgi:cysteine-rich repeat protein
MKRYLFLLLFGGCEIISPSAPCGNGVIQSNTQTPEQCDDDNRSNDDGCSRDCQIEDGFQCAGEPSICGICGDGEITAGLEECDDGNDTNDDECRSCKLPACGDGVTDEDLGEECDDGNTAAGDGCGPTCLAGCGDGVLQLELGEECDDANESDGDGCSSACVIEFCGDGVQLNIDLNGDGSPEIIEECDDGGSNSDDDPDACRTNCKAPSCGDGVTDPFNQESCDNGEDNSDINPDACRTDCQLPSCGDGVVDSFGFVAEGCDDGNQIDGDGCQTDCQLSSCGDGVLDIVPTIDTDGDGFPDTLEECDDGNPVDGDGCQSNCRLPFCGDGILDFVQTIDTNGDGSPDLSEECDDADAVDGNGCSFLCTSDFFVDCNDPNGAADFANLQQAIDASGLGRERIILLQEGSVCPPIIIDGENVTIAPLLTSAAPVFEDFPIIESNNNAVVAVQVISGAATFFATRISGSQAAALKIGNAQNKTAIAAVFSADVSKDPSNGRVIEVIGNASVVLNNLFVTSNLGLFNGTSQNRNGNDLGILCNGTSPSFVLMDQSVVAGNVFGGVKVEQSCNMIVTNSEIISNGSLTVNENFGGFAVGGNASLSIVQSSVVGNFRTAGSSSIKCENNVAGTNRNSINSILAGSSVVRNDGNPEACVSMTSSNAFSPFSFNDNSPDASGNISADPLFVDGNSGDFRLNSTSPCVNRGVGSIDVDSLAFDPLSLFDLDINEFLSRDRNDIPRPLGGAPDMGAHEVPF